MKMLFNEFESFQIRKTGCYSFNSNCSLYCHFTGEKNFCVFSTLDDTIIWLKRFLHREVEVIIKQTKKNTHDLVFILILLLYYTLFIYFMFT